MTDQEHLERAYRRLLGWYPREFRRENGPEILAVLMAGAPHGQRRPGLAESADLIRSGLWLRLRPSVPRSARTVRAAVKLMYAGAAVSTVNLIILMAIIGDIKAYHAVLGYHLTAAQVSRFTTGVHYAVDRLGPGPIVAVAVDGAGLRPGPELGAHRVHGAVRRGDAGPDRRLRAAGMFSIDVSEPRPDDTARPSPCCTGWSALAVVWLLWRPASRAHFRPPGYTQAQHQAQMAELDHQAQMAELARIRARLPRHV